MSDFVGILANRVSSVNHKFSKIFFSLLFDFRILGESESVLINTPPLWASFLEIIAQRILIAIHREMNSRIQVAAPSWRELLTSLPMPRTILFGERSLPHPDYSRLPGAGIGVDVVPGAGHSMMWQNPSGLAGALQRALA